mmetsp:Transcript_61191/g.162654  ORF Transcript_61191/g.162654 Transcript_61191/m.162654 type:complete len:336 (+) Transcript_61191:492-1499(+)
MRDHRVEGLQPNDHQHGKGHGVRGGHHRALPPHDIEDRQGSGVEGGLLQADGPKPHESVGHAVYILRGDLLPGISGRPVVQVPQDARAPRHLPGAVVLHIQHLHHPADGPGLQPLLLLAALVPEIQVEHARQSPRAVARPRLRGRVGSRRRPRVLHLPAERYEQHLGGPAPRVLLYPIRPLLLCAVLEVFYRGQWLVLTGRREDAARSTDYVQGVSGQVAAARPKPVHPDSGRVRRNVHRDAHDSGGFLGRDRERHGHPAGGDDNISAHGERAAREGVRSHALLSGARPPRADARRSRRSSRPSQPEFLRPGAGGALAEIRTSWALARQSRAGPM